jgi:hypothetical protein
MVIDHALRASGYCGLYSDAQTDKITVTSAPALGASRIDAGKSTEMLQAQKRRRTGEGVGALRFVTVPLAVLAVLLSSLRGAHARQFS